MENVSLIDMEILGQLVNTLRTNERYPLLKRDNLMIPIHTQLSRKQNTFPQFFKGFSKSRLNFKYFEKKDDTRTFCISEITTSKNMVI